MFRLPAATRAATRDLTAFRAPWRRDLPTRATRRAQHAASPSPSSSSFSTQSLARAARQTATAPRHAARQQLQQRRGFRFSPWSRSQTGGGAEAPLSLGQRLRKLSREYGKAAIGVYFLISALDLPVFFLLVKAVGADRIGRVEAYLVEHVIPESVRTAWNSMMAFFRKEETRATGDDTMSDVVDKASWGVGTANQHNKEDASLGTQLALAYAIHKAFIFVRVPLTAALTPKIVKTLRGWGWNIGKKVPK